MNNKFLFPVLLALCLVFSACTEGELPEDVGDISYEDDVKPLIEEDTNPSKSRGSCDAIASASRCFDYVGSMWTEEQMKLNCQGGGAFSLNACPYSDVGGCRTGADTITDTVIWGYNYGGAPLDGEELQYAIMACNAVTGSYWVYTPEELLNQ